MEEVPPKEDVLSKRCAELAAVMEATQPSQPMDKEEEPPAQLREERLPPPPPPPQPAAAPPPARPEKKLFSTQLMDIFDDD